MPKKYLFSLALLMLGSPMGMGMAPDSSQMVGAPSKKVANDS